MGIAAAVVPAATSVWVLYLAQELPHASSVAKKKKKKEREENKIAMNILQWICLNCICCYTNVVIS